MASMTWANKYKYKRVSIISLRPSLSHLIHIYMRACVHVPESQVQIHIRACVHVPESQVHIHIRACVHTYISTFVHACTYLSHKVLAGNLGGDHRADRHDAQSILDRQGARRRGLAACVCVCIYMCVCVCVSVLMHVYVSEGRL